MECVVDGSFGIYVPQTFVDRFEGSLDGVDETDLMTLRSGPDDPYYWEAWDSVVSSGTVDGLLIHQGESGDVFLASEEDLENLTKEE